MAFTPSTIIVNYTKSPPPLLKESERKYYDNELRKMSIAINSMADVIQELSDYVKTLP